MDGKIGLTSNLNEDCTIDNFDSEMVLLYGMELNVEEPIVAIGIEDKVGHPKESEMVYGDEEKKENYMEEVAGEDDPEEEVKNDDNPNEEVNVEDNIEEDLDEELRNDENPKEEENVEENNDEDPEEEVRNDENTKEEVNIEENKEEDPEEEVRNDENTKEEVSIEENKEEDSEEEVKNDENPKEEVTIEENDEKYPGEDVKNEEDARNDVRNEGKLEAISKKKLSKLRKRPQMLKKKKTALRTKVKNVHISTSKLDEDTEMISLPMIDENNTPNDVGTREVASEKNDISDDISSGVALSNQVKMNVVLEDEIGEACNEENTREELRNEGDTGNEAKAKEKLEGKSKKKASKWRKIDKKKKKALVVKNEVVVNNRDNPESSKKQVTIKEKCKGMIFMCSSKTKKDCYHYQVLGLPASKRDIVFEIYEGMKLFLFDFDLKLMYGIYEAAGPGGYNIEPKAFKSAFPSQVRFSVLEDCLPLPEEKFKKIIKDNYYSKIKFDCQLNSKQVEGLCELFRVASKGSTFKLLHGTQRVEASTFVDYGPKQPPRVSKAKRPHIEAPTFVDRKSKQPRRCMKAETQQAEAPKPVDHEPKWARKNRKAKTLQANASRPVDYEPKRPHKNRNAECLQAEPPTFVDRKSKQPRRSRKAETRPFADHKHKWLRQSLRAETQNFLYGDCRPHGWEDERHSTLARDHLYPEDPVAYRREVYESPLEHPPSRQPLHRQLASSIPSLERGVYRRDQLQYHDSYKIPRYEDDFDRRGSYLASRGYSSYHDPSSSVAQPSKHYTPASRTPASTYHLSAPPPDYQRHPAAYGYYP